MMKKIGLVIPLLFFFLVASVNAQIINGTDTLYGNEWIKFNQSYYKIMLSEDGMYQLTFQNLVDAGVPINQVQGAELQMFHNGEEIPIHTSTDGSFESDDRIVFYGEKNTSELDRYLYTNPEEEMMNPRYSLFTDTAAYFLTWTNTGTNLRYEAVQNDLNGAPPKEEYHQAEQVINLSSQHAKDGNSEGVRLSSFTIGEGFASNLSNVQSHTIDPVNPFIGGPDANLYLRYSGNYGSHQHRISLNGQELMTDTYFGYQVREGNFSVNNADLSGALEIKLEGMVSNNDRNRVSNIVLSYPKSFNADQESVFKFGFGASAKKYIEVENFNLSSGEAIAYDILNNQRIQASVDNGIVQLAIPTSSSDREFWLVNSNTGIKSVHSISPIEFVDFNDVDADFVFLSNPKLYDDGNGNNYVQEYAEYRASNEGGIYKPVIVDVQQVYDQFGWGLNRHSLSIRNFAHYVKREWEEVKYFFVVGKGREYKDIRLGSSLSSAIDAGFMVPTFGTPGSDNLLLAGEDKYTPIIPIGRIATKEPEEMQVYLEKVIKFEQSRDLPQTIEDRAWMKGVLHMGGGGSVGEQSSIKNYLLALEGNIESNQFGAEVQSFFKTSTDPIQVSQTEQIFYHINQGVSLITFFGHSSVGAFDFSIDNPENYNNYGKYPLIISLGCYSGNIHTGGQGVSEKFVFFKDKGAIAFSATSGQGYISSLYSFANQFYNLLGDALYGQGIGDILLATISSFGNNNFGVNLVRQQFNYHGDPSLRLNPSPGPDFIVDPSSVSFSPPNLTTELNSFDLSFEMVNLGRYVEDSIRLSIIQELPDGSKVNMANPLAPAPAFSEAMTVEISNLGKEALGFNRFYITVDDSNFVEELPLPVAENNNDLVINGEPGISIYITDNSAVAVYPPEFGIISSPDFELKATTADLLLPERKYVIELDTTELFNSPIKVTKKVVQPGGVIRWKPIVNWENEKVYYWRVSPDSISPTESYNWDYSSFVYLEDAGHGWNQSHFYQWKKDEFVNMELLEPGNLKFLDNFKDVYIKNAVNSVEQPIMFINNAYAGRYWYTPDAGMYVVVFDSTTVNNWVNSGPPYQYGLPQPNGWWVATYLFETVSQDGRQQLIDFLENVVPEKNYVFLFSVQNNLNSDYKPQDWESDQSVLGTDIFQVLENQGATLIRNTLQSGAVPYVFAYKKDVAPIKEALADSISQILEVDFSISGYWDRGALKTSPIGPAKQWKTLKWEPLYNSFPEADTISLDVFATNPVSQKDTLLISDLMPGEIDLSVLDAGQFPYLKLQFNSKDSLYRTSAQLKYWRILYDGYPDFTINPAGYYAFQSDTLPQGEPILLEYMVENLTDASGDSLLVKYTLRNQANEENISFQKVRPLQGNDTLIAKIQFDSRLISGNQRLSLELNPVDEQPELTHINNFLNTKFFVTRDIENPLLDVTFDGQHIIDGDLVSARPNIRIDLEDENEYLLLQDTSLFRIFLVYPDSASSLHRIYFDDPILDFFPASAGGNENKAAVELRPNLVDDGTYQLLVQAQDVAGNASGQYDYKVSFKVINKSMISNLLNYPNPFTTSTRFVYTMTGIKPPARYKIQIMTVSGRIVREIDQNELGPLKVGTHQTDFAWDGTDEYGDILAKGVYLYRVMMQDEKGEEWEKYETGADGFTKNGFGKMVLLR